MDPMGVKPFVPENLSFAAVPGSQIVVGWFRGIGGIYTYRSPRTTPWKRCEQRAFTYREKWDERKTVFFGGGSNLFKFHGIFDFLW